MKTRYPLLNEKESKRNYKNYLIDKKNNRYPIHKSISSQELTIFNDSEISLLGEIEHLKNINNKNFAIDGRYKDDDYYKIVEVYTDALNGHVDENKLRKYSSKNTLANY